MAPFDDRATARCPQCGTVQDAAASLCAACGAALALAASGAPIADMRDDATITGPAYSFGLRPPAAGSTSEAPDLPASFVPAGLADEQAGDVGGESPGEQTDDPEAAPTSTVGSRRCEWCGTLNPDEAERCMKCGAAFPRPEQDEALLRESRERIRAATESIDLMRRQRTRRGLGRWWDR